MAGFVTIDKCVAVATSVSATYGRLSKPVPAPELPSGYAETTAELAVRELLRIWGLDAERFGSKSWNPLGTLIPPGSRVTIKPNWVMHSNGSGSGLDCLITHPSVIEAVLLYTARARPAQVVLGDAPIQGCNFNALKQSCGIDDLVDRMKRIGLDLRLADFRGTIMPGRVGAAKVRNNRPADRYVLFDLKTDSLLEAITADGNFRVCLYDPEDLRKTHQAGTHQYLIAREVLEADVVINLPKLKCHRKAGISAALKNLVGMNGAKEYLPHHRFGGSDEGGDCYPGTSFLKRQSEWLRDVANHFQEGKFATWAAQSAEIPLRIAMKLGEDDNLDGAWHGNDTTWRMSLDLQRIRRYGTSEATLSDKVQRRVVTITDGIIGGQGEGPLQPSPAASRCLTGAVNDAAADWINARLMGFDPRKVPITREAFAAFRWPIADFEPREIRVLTATREHTADEVFPIDGVAFRPPKGWLNRCELEAPQCL
jgi:uncharacterized protein (DUF362 family)